MSNQSRPSVGFVDRPAGKKRMVFQGAGLAANAGAVSERRLPQEYESATV
jgi:hypothetical protein